MFEMDSRPIGLIYCESVDELASNQNHLPCDVRDLDAIADKVGRGCKKEIHICFISLLRSIPSRRRATDAPRNPILASDWHYNLSHEQGVCKVVDYCWKSF